MAGSPRQAPMVWEKISDDEPDDEVSSTTTVLIGDGVGAHAWSPSMDGSLRGRRAQGTPQQSVHASYVEPGAEAWSGSEWSWTWASESWSSDWSADPWSRHLDQHRPGWRRDRKSENWDDLTFAWAAGPKSRMDWACRRHASTAAAGAAAVERRRSCTRSRFAGRTPPRKTTSSTARFSSPTTTGKS